MPNFDDSGKRAAFSTWLTTEFPMTKDRSRTYQGIADAMAAQ
jgi:hypothetical protein